MALSHTEMARVTGPPKSILLTSGQQKKGYTMILSTIHRQGRYVVPTFKVDVSDVTYQGATVIDCKKGFYELPVAVLDFVSLYPSIMYTWNLCYSTHIADPKVRARMRRQDYILSPFGTNHAFVKAGVQWGVLPLILKHLLKARKAAQAKMKTLPKDSAEYSVLNKRQTQYKLACNSMYGFLKANTMPRPEIAETVTAFGRLFVNLAKETVEEEFTIANGYECNAEVVYGDTDSIFVLFGVKDHKRVCELSKIAETKINARVKAFCKANAGLDDEDIIMRIEFEKFYDPVLLGQKDV